MRSLVLRRALEPKEIHSALPLTSPFENKRFLLILFLSFKILFQFEFISSPFRFTFPYFESGPFTGSDFQQRRNGIVAFLGDTELATEVHDNGTITVTVGLLRSFCSKNFEILFLLSRFYFEILFFWSCVQWAFWLQVQTVLAGYHRLRVLMGVGCLQVRELNVSYTSWRFWDCFQDSFPMQKAMFSLNQRQLSVLIRISLQWSPSLTMKHLLTRRGQPCGPLWWYLWITFAVAVFASSALLDSNSIHNAETCNYKKYISYK